MAACQGILEVAHNDVGPTVLWLSGIRPIWFEGLIVYQQVKWAPWPSRTWAGGNHWKWFSGIRSQSRLWTAWSII